MAPGDLKFHVNLLKLTQKSALWGPSTAEVSQLFHDVCVACDRAVVSKPSLSCFILIQFTVVSDS